MEISLGSRIVTARKAAGFTQGDLATRLGVSEISLLRYEKGQRQPDAVTLYRIVAETGCDARWLLTGDEPEEGKSGVARNLQPIEPYSPAGGEPLQTSERPPIYAADFLDPALAKLVSLLEWVYTRSDPSVRRELRGGLEELVDRIKAKKNP